MNKTYYRYAGVYIFTYFALASFLPYLSKYLGSKGLSLTQIGIIAAMGSLAGLISRPLMGLICDKTRQPRKIILLLIALSIIFAIVLTLVKSYFVILFIYIIMMFFLSPVNTLIDATALGSKHGFGDLRQWGAYGFAFGSLITGIIANKFGIQIVFIVFSLSNIISLLVFRKIKIERRKTALGAFEGLGTLAKNKRYILFIICAIFMHGTITANNTYFPVLYTSVGGSTLGIGIAFFLFASAEAPFMKLSDKILKKIKIEDLLLISISVSAAKLFWYSSSPSKSLLIVTFLIHGLSTGFYIVAAIRFIRENTREEVTATALSVYASLGTGVSTVLCNYLGGVVADNYGVGMTYKMFGAFAIVSLVIVMVIKKVKPVNKQAIKLEKNGSEV